VGKEMNKKAIRKIMADSGNEDIDQAKLFARARAIPAIKHLSIDQLTAEIVGNEANKLMLAGGMFRRSYRIARKDPNAYSKMQSDSGKGNRTTRSRYLEGCEIPLRLSATPQWRLFSQLFPPEEPAFLPTLDKIVGKAISSSQSTVSRSQKNKIVGVVNFVESGILIKGKSGRISAYEELFELNLETGLWKNLKDGSRLLELWNHERENIVGEGLWKWVVEIGVPLPSGPKMTDNVVNDLYGEWRSLPRSSALYYLSEILDVVFPGREDGMIAVF
jgi:hypothetical protein